MTYYDIFYREPDGVCGTHHALEAENIYDAARLSALQCAALTNTSPWDWRVLNIVETAPENWPQQITDNIEGI